MRARKHFDILGNLRYLKEAGLEVQVAEAIAKVQADTNKVIMTNLFEGEDKLVTESMLKYELGQVRSEIKEVEHRLDKLALRVDGLANQLTLRLTGITLGGLALLSGLFHIIH